MCEKYSGIYKDMVEILGEEVVLRIYEHYKGQQVTFPMRIYSKSFVIEYIMKNYNGKNIKEIARELGYTSNWIQQIVKKEKLREKLGDKNVL
ncbi:Mor transcription activator family protein [uncultured Clostridium sp.]|uniref:Mor transcription activator family protein n=1 Tax=uncultured Clostridium sp. TaxID=59620 RepID=UPI002635150C|nr:Mor transcription activator family protein [uncultured Clostridium sp.]